MTTSEISAPRVRGEIDPTRVRAMFAPGRRPDMYGRALLSRRPDRAAGAPGFRVRDGEGRVRALDDALDRWMGPCDAADRTVLDRCAGLTLDVGCGPGRLVAELHRPDALPLGIDVNEVAVQLTRSRGGAAERADVFGPVPGQRYWHTVVLLDGNLGIGGNPRRLFARCHSLLAPGGQVLVEAAPPRCASGPGRRRLESGDEIGPWFPWATLDVAGVAACAASASLQVRESWSEGDRWFTALTA